jgi:prepilin-type N-terminal cleavage/methylation domain-containing protein
MKQSILQNISSRGFTLIELLVVIAIIGILAGLSMIGMRGVFERARDTERKSDLEQYAVLLEEWANDHNGIYVVHENGAWMVDHVCAHPSRFNLTFAKCPEDPILEKEGITAIDEADPATPNIWIGYHYRSQGNGTSYRITARLEAGNKALYTICSDGTRGEHSGYTAGCPAF